jgi:hypothetical protein
MTIDEKHLLELCQQAAREKNSKKRLALTQQIDQSLADACQAWERLNPLGRNYRRRNDHRLPPEIRAGALSR